MIRVIELSKSAGESRIVCGAQVISYSWDCLVIVDKWKNLLSIILSILMSVGMKSGFSDKLNTNINSSCTLRIE